MYVVQSGFHGHSPLTFRISKTNFGDKTNIFEIEVFHLAPLGAKGARKEFQLFNVTTTKNHI